MFVKKKDGSLRLCVDHRALNAVTTKDKYPIPRIDDLLDTVRDGRIFSTIDLLSGYNQVRKHPRDTQKTAFQTQLGSFEYLVMPFGLTNAPATFNLMNNVFNDMISKHVIVYLDDILVFSRTLREHLTHLRQVLQSLREHKLFAGIKTFRSAIGPLPWFCRLRQGYLPRRPESRRDQPLADPIFNKRHQKLPRIDRVLPRLHQGLCANRPSAHGINVNRKLIQMDSGMSRRLQKVKKRDHRGTMPQDGGPTQSFHHSHRRL